MGFIRKKYRRECIVCKKAKRRKSSLFCNKCFGKDIMTKILYFRESMEFKKGWITGKNMHYGKTNDDANYP